MKEGHVDSLRQQLEHCEFLDDAIRMKDQPLMYTEESVAPASPESFLNPFSGSSQD